MVEAIQVTIEVGHKAFVKEKPDSKGNTHDWNVFVRGGDNQSIEKFVQKVVFNLHETFKKPQRVKNEPPYCVKESGYGMFEFPIEIYFNGTNETYKINYYLELQGIDDRKPFSRLRKETITFQNPQPEFRKCLLDGGGILKSLDSTTSPLNIFQQQSVPIVTSQNSPDKLTNPATIIYQPQIKHESTTFSDLFGQPVERKTKKPQTADKNKSSKQANFNDESVKKQQHSKLSSTSSSSTPKISSQDTSLVGVNGSNGAGNISSSELNKSSSKKRANTNEENYSNEKRFKTSINDSVNEQSIVPKLKIKNPPKSSESSFKRSHTSSEIQLTSVDQEKKQKSKVDDLNNLTTTKNTENSKQTNKSNSTSKLRNSLPLSSSTSSLNKNSSQSKKSVNLNDRKSIGDVKTIDTTTLKSFQVTSSQQQALNDTKNRLLTHQNKNSSSNNRPKTLNGNSVSDLQTSPSSTSTLSPVDSDTANSIASTINSSNDHHNTTSQLNNRIFIDDLNNNADLTRIINLFEKIELIKMSKNIDLLTKICSIVKPFSYVDKKLFKFDLFSLNSNILDEIETILKKLLVDSK